MNEQRNLDQARVVSDYIREGPDRCTLVVSTGYG